MPPPSGTIMRVSLPPGSRYDRLENAVRGPADAPSGTALDEETSHIANRRGRGPDGPGDTRPGLRLVVGGSERQTTSTLDPSEDEDHSEDHGRVDVVGTTVPEVDRETLSARPADAEEQFSELFRAMHTEVRTFVLRRLDLDLVDDVVGDTFLAVWHGWEKVPSDPSGRRAWVYGVLRNKLLQATQNVGRRARLRSKVAAMRPTGGGPVDEGIESLRAARELLDLLPPAERDAVAFTVLAGLSCAETAEVLECSVSSVTTRVSRARTRLRTILLERETTEHDGGDRP